MQPKGPLVPEQNLSDMPLLTEAERHLPLAAWNATKAEYHRHRCIHDLFEAQVQRTPQAIALIFKGEQLTYQELNRRANQLAHYLQKRGVGPEVLVGVYLERSVEMVVGLLAILKAGAAYVPLDLSYPPERLAFILNDARVSVILTHQQLVDAGRLPKHGEYIVSSSRGEEIVEESVENAISRVQPQNMAYVIYTSGSTGRPKGVAIEHRSTVALLAWSRMFFAPEHLAGVLASTSICFDLSVFELFVPLCSGGTVILAENLLHLPSLPALEEVTLINTVPSVLAELLRRGVLPPSVRAVNLAGEQLSTRLVQQVYQQETIQQVFNLYGPSEDTTYSTYALIEKESNTAPPIGRPIANTQVYLLDQHLQPVAIGEPGELYISGAGLARGYLHHPELTAERFIPNPFADEPGERLYRTGDLARYRPDGDIEFIGRLDHQVKLRGFRIELGEIEAVLAEHPAVREAVVLAREDVPGDKRLVAYVVLQPQQDPVINHLRDYLQGRLPDYMLPSAFVLLEALPLSPNGKVDRQALPPPSRTRPPLQENYIAPRSPVEKMLTGIWSEILGFEQIGIHDNFFNLGGHSLLATQVVSRVRETLQKELPLQSFFEYPTVSELARIIEKDSWKEQCHSFSPIRPVPREVNLPLSFSQERVWFIQQLDPTSLSYNFQATLRITGALSVTTLEQCLNEIVRRHEILRTTFHALDGHPVQRVHQFYSIKLPVIDLSSTLESEREAQRLTFEEFRKPFDPTQLPLVRWTLLRLNAQEHILIHVENHLIHDGWSFNVLLSELLDLYQAFSLGKPSPLPELPIQFADFAQWQRQWMQEDVAEMQLAYWKAKLTNSPPVLELPTSRPRPAVQSSHGAALRMELPPGLCESLRILSRQEQVTLFMTMLATFLTLLYRYSGQNDICVGTGIANRRWKETESLIGMIINTLVLHTELSGIFTFRELLRRVREVATEAYAHQDLPYDMVVKALEPERYLSHNPLFQVMFSFHDAPLPNLELPGLDISLLEGLSNGSAKFDLNVIVIPRAEQRAGRNSPLASNGITMIWEYSTDLFDETMIHRMVAHYQTLLEGIVADPLQRLSELPLLTQAERQQLLVDWNKTKTGYSQHSCIHDLFEVQVESTPEAVAAVFEDEQFTYRELNQRANQLAHYLQELGVEPEVLVGICVERSLQMVVGLLAILKAGGAYLPLDPSYPPERLAFMLQDARIPVLLTQQKFCVRLPTSETRVICLDADWEVISTKSKANTGSEVLPENLAYVIYTSGSTGRPKGVSVTHRNVVRLVKETNYVSLTAEEVFLQLAPISFDASTFEIWACLLNGARLVIFPAHTPSLEELGEVLERNEITTLWLTAGLFHQMVEEHPNYLGHVRQLLAGGDVLSASHVTKVLRQGSVFCVINGYGPTEGTTFTCTFTMNSPDQLGGSLPIGRPIANTQVYILDADLNPVPIGVPGELYIGGDGLARGYLNRSELTAAFFIPNPFSEEPGTRLYKTGDMVRYRQDGNIEFLGRRDTQVKLRGFRIELGEIEAVLAEHPAIRAAVVLAREDMPGDKRLVAYVMPNVNHKPTISELRDYLQAKLPDYMLPSGFVLLEALPLSPNGKVDRRLLPAPGSVRCELGEACVAPRNPVEEVLLDIWAGVLGTKRISIHDNFFVLGGHSLMATQVISRIHDTFQVELPLRSLFEMPTVAELTSLLLRDPSERMRVEKTAQLLTRLAQLSDADVETILEAKTSPYEEG